MLRGQGGCGVGWSALSHCELSEVPAAWATTFAREGPERFALEGLTESQKKELAWGDAILWMRQLYPYYLAQQSREKKVVFLKERHWDL